MLFARSTQDNATGPDGFFTCATRLEETCNNFLFTGVAVKELTSPTSLRHWICQKHSHYGVYHKQSSLRGGNDDRNGIYSSPTEVISNAISFVSPFHGGVAKNSRASHMRWNKMC